MLELVIYRGLPASGKTTLAKAYVAADPEHRARVNRDDLREMLHGGYVSPPVERVVRIARDRLVKAFLDQGISVACDDTNLPQRAARDLAGIARFVGAHVRVSDMTDVDVELCILRDLARGENGGRSVGETVIRGMHDRYLGGKSFPLPFPADGDEPAPPERYVAKPGTPRAILVDLDGTLCLHNGRSPYDETRVAEDLPNRAVVEAVRAARLSGLRVVFCSGRTEGCRVASERWIDEHLFDASDWRRDAYPAYDALLMRAEGDRRKDAIVKREIFDREIRDRYDVVYVLDDRDQVVQAWRELGLTVFQVADGAF